MTTSVPMEFPVDYLENGDGTVKAVYRDQGSRLRVFFKKVRTADVAKMLQTGQEEWKEEILLYKKVKGSTNVPASRATEADKRIYHREWEAFKRGETEKGSNSLSDLYGIKAPDLYRLHEVGIGSIDELLEAPEDLISAIEGGKDLQELARIWDQTRKKEEQASEAVKLLATKEQENKALLAEIEKLKKQVSKPKTKAKSKRKAKVGVKEE